MTRGEFLEESRDWSWYDLRSFCDDEGCDLCLEVYSSDERDECIENSLMDMARTVTWRGLRDFLDDLLDSCVFYERDNYGDWNELDNDDLEIRIRDVFEWMEYRDRWDEEDDEDDITPIEDESVSISGLLIACNKELKSIGERRVAEE